MFVYLATTTITLSANYISWEPGACKSDTRSMSNEDNYSNYKLTNHFGLHDQQSENGGGFESLFSNNKTGELFNWRSDKSPKVFRLEEYFK